MNPQDFITRLFITRHGGPTSLEIKEVPPSDLPPGFLRIEVKAAGVNFADIMMRMGLYPEAPKLPFTPGYEIAGEVIEVGKGVQGFKIGDRVLAGTRFGGYASEVILSEFQVRKIPGNLAYEEAAGILVNFLTAWIAVQEMGRVRAGDRVVIPSAAGGVGTAAVQIAAKAGAKVTGLVGSLSKADIVKSLGAAEVLTYDQWNDPKHDRKYQIVLDATGGASLKLAYSRLAPTGRVITYGASSLVSGEKRSFRKLFSFAFNMSLFTPLKLMNDNKGIFGVNLLQLFEGQDSSRTALMLKSFDQVLEHFEKGDYKVIIGKTFPLEKAGEAQAYLQSRSNIGKVVLIPTHSGTRRKISAH